MAGFLMDGYRPSVAWFWEFVVLFRKLTILGVSLFIWEPFLQSFAAVFVLIAALAYREQGRKKGITHPQIVCGLSAHPAIVKACHYFGIELLKAPVEAGSNKLRASAVKPLLTRNTVAIYASAPSFSFGCVDAIEELGELARREAMTPMKINCQTEQGEVMPCCACIPACIPFLFRREYFYPSSSPTTAIFLSSLPPPP